MGHRGTDTLGADGHWRHHPAGGGLSKPNPERQYQGVTGSTTALLTRAPRRRTLPDRTHAPSAPWFGASRWARCREGFDVGMRLVYSPHPSPVRTIINSKGDLHDERS